MQVAECHIIVNMISSVLLFLYFVATHGGAKTLTLDLFMHEQKANRATVDTLSMPNEGSGTW